MSDDVVVMGYADLAADRKLAGADPDRVARALQASEGRDDRLVAWLPEGLAVEKDLPPIEGSSQLVAGVIEAETEKAYLIAAGRREAWLPKSVIRRYRLDAGVELSIPQHSLTDYAEEGSS